MDAAVGEDQIRNQGGGRDRCLREDNARVGRDGQRPEPGTDRNAGRSATASPLLERQVLREERDHLLSSRCITLFL